MQYPDRALAMEPNNVNTASNKVGALSNLGRHEEAMQYIDRALAIEPNNVNALTNKGITLAGSGRYEEAIGSFDRVLKIDPNYSPALVNKGVALGNLGRHQEAMEYFEKTSLTQKSSITTAPYYSNVDLQLDNLGRDKEETYALHFISNGHQIDINKETNLGIARFSLGDYQGAIVTFNGILRLHEMHPSELVQKPELAASLYNKGLSLEKLGNLEGAEQFKNQAHNVNPNYKGGYIHKADFSAPALGLPPPPRT
jgi:tetratricopeptide (TPR) repeat protein